MLGGLQGLNMSLQYNAKFQQKVHKLDNNGTPLKDENGDIIYQWVFPIVASPMGGVRTSNLMLFASNKHIQPYHKNIYTRLYSYNT